MLGLFGEGLLDRRARAAPDGGLVVKADRFARLRVPTTVTLQVPQAAGPTDIVLSRGTLERYDTPGEPAGSF